MSNFRDTMLDFRDDTLDFIDDHRKQLIIASIVVIVLLIALIIIIFVVQPVKVYIANTDSKMGNIVGTKAQELDLYAYAQQRGKILEGTTFEWEAQDGTITQNSDGSIVWHLPTDEGTYAITAKAGDAKTTKYVTVLGSDLSELYKKSDQEITLLDTDGDGLTDIYEGSTSKTNQTLQDTDNDGLYDGDEVALGLNPLKADSKDDGVQDGQRKQDYTFKLDNVTMKMTGSGNFTRTSVDKYSTETLDNVQAVVDGIYAFYTEATLDSAQITINYDEKNVTDKGINESNLAVYLLNEDDNSFTKLRTTIDAENNTATFNVDELGKYFIADSSTISSRLATELVFLIDNSGSMYSSEETASGENIDVDFKRVDVVNALITKLQGNYRFGAGKFTGQYQELVGLSSDKQTVINRISSIKTQNENFSGTYIGAAVEGGLKQFGDEQGQNRRYMILLTDGTDSSNIEGYDGKLLTDQLEIAKQKGVKIYTVGLGAEADSTTLKDIATTTNGKYYFAAIADDLEDIFDEISADLNYNLYDTDSDGKDDSVIIADSTFLVGRDGFSFSNFANTQVEYGYGYGMALFTKMFFENNLPSSLPAKTVTENGTKIEAPSANPNSAAKIKKGDVTTLRTYKPESLKILAEIPADFWASSVNNGTLQINSAQKKQLQSLGFTTYLAPYNGDNARFKNYETIKFNMTNYLTDDGEGNKQIDEMDVNMLKTLARLDITKYRDEKFDFAENNDDAFAKLKDELNKGSTVMLRINDDYTVLACKLLADAKNMNKYKIEVYDPNYAGIPKYIDVERYKFSDIAEISKVVTDRYEYKFSYQGTEVNICISEPNVIEVE